MPNHVITVEPLNQLVSADEQQTVLDALHQAGIAIPSACGGEGTCHQCRVLLIDGDVDPVDESNWWTQPDDEDVWVLACQSLPRGDITIRLSPRALAGDLVALTTISTGMDHLEEATGGCRGPLVRRIKLHLDPPTVTDPRPDFQRLERAMQNVDPDLPPLHAPVPLLRTMPTLLRKNDFNVSALVADYGPYRQLMDLTPIGSRPPTVGMAVDIGTSTVVVQLVDLTDASLLQQAAAGNAQARHGSDVISRIMWSEEHDDGPGKLHQLIADQISELADDACGRAECHREGVMAASITGNSTMLALMLGTDPAPIRREPHPPVASDLPVFEAQGLDLGIQPRAPVFFSPGVSGFVGGDITAGVLATGMAWRDELSLLVDVGTNGEIVLGCQDWLMCCSCSAGPAFEGVDIESGVHAVAGAIESVEYDPANDAFEWTTIADRSPIGLCGTGLLEALATMFRGAVLDRNGDLVPDADTDRIREGDGQREIVIAYEGEGGAEREIILRESEIENLIRSKAAVYAGINSLFEALDLSPDAVENVYIAGAFGNRLKVEDAVAIGMLPDIPRDRIAFAGNTALAGAYLTLMCRQARDQIIEIAHNMTYMELSAVSSFMDEFVAAMFLPHTDLNRFPSQS